MTKDGHYKQEAFRTLEATVIGDTVKLSFAPLHKVYETWPNGDGPDYSVDLAQMSKP